MFQPRAKYEFAIRYCPPSKGWKVFVDIDASEEGRTGGPRLSAESVARQKAMQTDAEIVLQNLKKLNVQIGGNRSDWFEVNSVPVVEGDCDIVAFNPDSKVCVIAEVEGASTGQPETKLYKAMGQIIRSVSGVKMNGWNLIFIVVVFGEMMTTHLEKMTALDKNLGVKGLSIAERKQNDNWVFGKPNELN